MAYSFALLDPFNESALKATFFFVTDGLIWNILPIYLRDINYTGILGEK